MSTSKAAHITDVEAGQVRLLRGRGVLRSTPLGSCIAVGALDAADRVGAMAHIMLPGPAPAGSPGAARTRYAADALDEMLMQLHCAGARFEDLELAAVGGANVLQRPDDALCAANIRSVLRLLGQIGLCLSHQSLGGCVRRRLWIDVAEGAMYCADGDGEAHRFRVGGVVMAEEP